MNSLAVRKNDTKNVVAFIANVVAFIAMRMARNTSRISFMLHPA